VLGRLLAANKTVLCALEETRIRTTEMKLTSMVVPNQTMPATKTQVEVEFFAPLSQIALQYIESQRKAAPHDVTLEVEIWGQAIVPSGGGLYTESRDLPSEQGRRGASAITVAPDQSKGGSWLLLQDGHHGFLKSQAFQLNGYETVASSHWTQFFAPRLGLGTFMVVDLPVPLAPEGVSLDEGITMALRGLQAAQKELVAGDDDKVIAALRPAAEALRARLPELKKLLQDDGYPDDATSTYQTVVENTFTLCSKFLHNTDKQKNLRPEVHAKHEDVQFVFTQMTTMLNLLLKKTARHNP
jgi:beta-galactosidase beta subunit